MQWLLPYLCKWEFCLLLEYLFFEPFLPLFFFFFFLYDEDELLELNLILFVIIGFESFSKCLGGDVSMTKVWKIGWLFHGGNFPRLVWPRKSTKMIELNLSQFLRKKPFPWGFFFSVEPMFHNCIQACPRIYLFAWVWIDRNL